MSMDENTLAEENCPTCGKLLNPALKSGRQVCSACGWTDKPKSFLSPHEPETSEVEVLEASNTPSKIYPLNEKIKILFHKLLKIKISNKTKGKHASKLKLSVIYATIGLTIISTGGIFLLKGFNSSLFGNTPKSVTEEYLKAMINGDSLKASEYWCDKKYYREFIAARSYKYYRTVELPDDKFNNIEWSKYLSAYPNLKESIDQLSKKRFSHNVTLVRIDSSNEAGVHITSDWNIYVRGVSDIKSSVTSTEKIVKFRGNDTFPKYDSELIDNVNFSKYYKSVIFRYGSLKETNKIVKYLNHLIEGIELKLLVKDDISNLESILDYTPTDMNKEYCIEKIRDKTGIIDSQIAEIEKIGLNADKRHFSGIIENLNTVIQNWDLPNEVLLTKLNCVFDSICMDFRHEIEQERINAELNRNSQESEAISTPQVDPSDSLSVTDKAREDPFKCIQPEGKSSC
jgi:ribosomal protein S27AE